MFECRKITNKDLVDLAIIEERGHQIKDIDFDIYMTSEHAWDETDIAKAISGVMTTSILIQEGKANTVGYLIYVAGKKTFRILRLLVDVSYRRCGFGQALLSRLLKKAQIKQYVVTALIREDDTATATWLAQQGFRAKLVRNGWNDHLDAIEFTRDPDHA